MYAQNERPKENKSGTVANLVTQKKKNEKQGLWFVDNRSEVIAQRKMKKIMNNSPQVRQLKAFKGTTIQFNGEGLRRRFPAPPEPEREPERDYQGPPLKEKIEAYLADAQARPDFYATKGLLGTISFIIGQIGLNIPKAVFNLIKAAPGLSGNFQAMMANYRNGDNQNAAAEAATIASTVASIIETAIGTEGTISYAITGAVYGSGAGKKKLKKD